MSQVSSYDLFSPTDYRYSVDELIPFLSEEAFVKYKAKVETALAKVQYNHGLLSKEGYEEIEKACLQVTAEETYKEEEKTRHDIIALRNVIQNRLTTEEAKSAVHRAATSYDIVETANAARYRDAFRGTIIPDMIKLADTWADQAREYKDLPQIGRTHLQHAEPITYGFTLAWYLSRFGDRIAKIDRAVDGLKGKFSGSVGAYNASSLFFDMPEDFEREVLNEMHLAPGEMSTQIAQPEPITDLVHYTTAAFGILANWANDMRNLERPEIAEVGQARGSKDTSASSIMPHKVNPVGLENIISLWKATEPMMGMLYRDQLSDHQRDLTNSASSRYVPQLFVQFDYAVRRAARIAKSLKPHEHNMKKNLAMSSDKIVSEPLQVILSSYGHPTAHTYVEELVARSESSGVPLRDLVFGDPSLKEYIDRFTETQREAIENPEKYIGAASLKAAAVADNWKEQLKEIEALNLAAN